MTRKSIKVSFSFHFYLVFLSYRNHSPLIQLVASSMFELFRRSFVFFPHRDKQNKRQTRHTTRTLAAAYAIKSNKLCCFGSLFCDGCRFAHCRRFHSFRSVRSVSFRYFFSTENVYVKQDQQTLWLWPSLSHSNDEIYSSHKIFNLYNEVTTCDDFCVERSNKSQWYFWIESIVILSHARSKLNVQVHISAARIFTMKNSFILLSIKRIRILFAVRTISSVERRHLVIAEVAKDKKRNFPHPSLIRNSTDYWRVAIYHQRWVSILQWKRIRDFLWSADRKNFTARKKSFLSLRAAKTYISTKIKWMVLSSLTHPFPSSVFLYVVVVFVSISIITLKARCETTWKHQMSQSQWQTDIGWCSFVSFVIVSLNFAYRRLAQSVHRSMILKGKRKTKIVLKDLNSSWMETSAEIEQWSITASMKLHSNNMFGVLSSQHPCSRWKCFVKIRWFLPRLLTFLCRFPPSAMSHSLHQL